MVRRSSRTNSRAMETNCVKRRERMVVDMAVHTKSGMRNNPMPGARSLMTVVRMLMALSIDEKPAR